MKAHDKQYNQGFKLLKIFKNSTFKLQLPKGSFIFVNKGYSLSISQNRYWVA